MKHLLEMIINELNKQSKMNHDDALELALDMENEITLELQEIIERHCKFRLEYELTYDLFSDTLNRGTLK